MSDFKAKMHQIW